MRLSDPVSVKFKIETQATLKKLAKRYNLSISTLVRGFVEQALTAKKAK